MSVNSLSYLLLKHIQIDWHSQPNEKKKKKKKKKKKCKISVPDKTKNWEEEEEDRDVTGSFMQTVCPARHLHTHTTHTLKTKSVLISKTKARTELQP